MKKATEYIEGLLGDVSGASLPLSEQDAALCGLLRGAVLYAREAEEPLTRSMPARGGLAPETEDGFSLDELDIQYSLDDLLGQAEGLLDEEISEEEAKQKLYGLFANAVTRSRDDSSLSGYGCDMVYSITQRALNAVLKEYLDTMEDREARAYYVIPSSNFAPGMSGNPHFPPMMNPLDDFAEATAEETTYFESLRLFDIPAEENCRTMEQKERIAAAAARGLFCAISGAFGLPEEADLSQIGNIIELNPGPVDKRTCVDYNLYFRRLCILSVINGYGNAALQRVEQGEEPWVFHFKMNLALADVARGALPEAVAQKLGNMDPDSMFSVQQLYLALNSTHLCYAPCITQVPRDVSDLLKECFTQVYFRRLQEAAGGSVVFAYALKPSGAAAGRQYLMHPTDLRFYISPYCENGWVNEKKRHLSTLNYVVACDGRCLPQMLKPFSWNWVEEADASSVHGSMAISRDSIMNFASREFEQIVAKLVFRPEMPAAIYGHSEDIMRLERFDRMLFHNSEFHHHPSSGARERTGAMEAGLDYHLDAKVSSYQSADGKAVVECRCDVRADLRVRVLAGQTRGTVFNKTLWYTLTIDINEYGKLLLTPTVREQDNGTNFSIDFSRQLASFGNLRTVADDIKNPILSALEETKRFAAQDFNDKFNGQAVWVLPGDRTFVFKQPRFSCGNDLTFDITYAKAQD